MFSIIQTEKQMITQIYLAKMFRLTFKWCRDEVKRQKININ